MLGRLYSGSATLQGHGSDSTTFVSRGFMGPSRQDSGISEEHGLKELNRIRSGVRAPRRSQTHYDYQLPSPSPSTTTLTIHTIRQQPQQCQPVEPVPAASSIPPPSFASSEQNPPSPPAPSDASQRQPPSARRPPLGPPRRSYSVMDYEPMPHHHRPSARGMTLLDLPRELHYAIFDFLDPIDSTCLALAAKDLYAVHRRMHGTVPLSARRGGPNELEWAWHLAGARSPLLASSKMAAAAVNKTDENSNGSGNGSGAWALAKLRVRGQAYCRKCGVCRCELHKHIQDWMGEGLEYCSVKQKFGPVAPEGSKPFCYMSVPKDPHRCGRHRAMKSKVVLQ